MTRPCFRRHRWLTLAAVNAVLLAATAAGLELAYRRQVVDFYRTELEVFNRSADLGDRAGAAGPTVVVFGDSFAAGADGLVAMVRGELGDDVRVVSSAVAGTSVREVDLMLDRRLARFRPELVVLQVYLGNDLADLRHPVDWRRVGPARNLYWLVTDHGLGVLAFANYKLRQLADRARLGLRSTPEQRLAAAAVAEARPFAAADYRARERTLLAADPRLIVHQLALSGPMAAAWARYRTHLERVLERCRRADVAVVVLVLPHCVQVHDAYRDRFRHLGAELPDGDHRADPPPFAAAIRAVATARPGVTVVDPLAALQAAESAGGSVYQHNDDHLNDRGRQVVASELARVLRALLTAHAAASVTTASVTTVASAAPTPW